VTRVSRNLPFAVLTFLAIAAVMLVSGSILVVSSWCGLLLGFIALLALLAGLPQPKHRRWYVRLALAVMLGAVAHTVLRFDSGVHRLVGLSWLFAMMSVTGYSRHARCGAAAAGLPWLHLHWGTLALAGLLVWYQASPRPWFAARRAVSFMGFSGTAIGPWASGLPVYVLGGLLVIVALITGARRRRVARGLLILCAGYPVGTVLLSMWEPIGVRHVSIHQLASVALVSAVISWVELTGATRPGRRWSARHLWAAGASTVAILVFGSHPADIPACPTGVCPPGPSYALYSRGMLDWGVPEVDRVGLVNSGMFGLLKTSLERRVQGRGGEVILVDSLSPGDLSRVGVVAFINPTAIPTEKEVAALEDFTSSGGGVLVLGDHTDIGGSREPLNTILSFTRIRYNFDSAIPLRKHWHGCLEIRRHETTRGVDDEMLLQMAVGASLEIEQPAFPLVIGRYGFADIGDYSNGGRGANMGTRRHETGEPIGDLVLVAGQRVGRGRVLVFGDTSPFQNAALFMSGRLVAEAIAWLGGNDSAGTGTAGTDTTGVPSLVFGDDRALIDFSLRPLASLELFTDRSLGGLANTLARAGIAARPALSSDEWTRGAAYIFMVNPTRSPEQREVTWLVDYVAGGGNLLICRDHHSANACHGMLTDLGFSIEPIPLGGGGTSSTVKHKAAWPVSYAGGADTSVVATAFGYPTIVTARLGDGTVTVVGDGRLMLDEALEGEFKGSPDNIRFIIDLVDGLGEKQKHEIASCR
jgi:hypothetical protein